MTNVPLLGMPLIVTNKNAGPGWNRFGKGGGCAVWMMIVPSLCTVNVLFNCMLRWPWFIACVVKPWRINHTVVFPAASSGLPV
jgi:hypothetical protein